MATFRLFPKRPNHTQGCWSSSNAFLMLEALSVVKQTIFSFGIFQAWRILSIISKMWAWVWSSRKYIVSKQWDISFQSGEM